MTNLLEKYDQASKEAVAKFKAAVTSAKERELLYEVSSREAIDIAKAELLDAQQRINERYAAELDAAISSAKQSVVSATTINKIEYESVKGFIESVQTELIVNGAGSAIGLMESYRDQITDKQAQAVFQAIAPQLSDVPKSDIQYIHGIMANGSNELRKAVADLEALKLESPDLSIRNHLLAEKTAQKSIGSVASHIGINE